jgi:uncharacterized protein (DUF58 family)
MLSTDEARQLDRLALGAGTAAASAGRRSVKAHGHSVEFHDFRGYQPGDDPRSIDWTVDARLRQLVVRTFRSEGHVPLHLLVDTSASMGIGRPSKLTAVAKAAAALAYVAALRRDPVGVATFDSDIEGYTAARSGRPHLFRIFEMLTAVRAVGASSLDLALTRYGAAVRGPGLAVVLSDFFDPKLTLDGFRYLMFRGLSLAIVQILADEEISPVFDDAVEIVDIEDPSAQPIVVIRDAIREYRTRMERASGDLRSFCATRGVPFIRLSSSCAFDDFVKTCSDAGLLELHG